MNKYHLFEPNLAINSLNKVLSFSSEEFRGQGENCFPSPFLGNEVRYDSMRDRTGSNGSDYFADGETSRSNTPPNGQFLAGQPTITKRSYSDEDFGLGKSLPGTESSPPRFAEFYSDDITSSDDEDDDSSCASTASDESGVSCSGVPGWIPVDMLEYQVDPDNTGARGQKNAYSSDAEAPKQVSPNSRRKTVFNSLIFGRAVEQ